MLEFWRFNLRPINSDPKFPREAKFLITNNGRLVEKASFSTWDNAGVFGTTTFTCGIHYWEIIHVRQGQTNGMCVGVTSDVKHSYLTAEEDILMENTGATYNCENKASFQGNEGDRYGVLLDFDKLKITFFWNGKEVCWGRLKKGKKYVPVVHIFWQGDAVKVHFPNNVL